jgi:mono/diheme cytochrome c family protein
MSRNLLGGFMPLFLLGAVFGSEIKAANVNSAQIERGRYLVHESVLCVDCHSPRDEKGRFIAGKHLTGAALPFVPTVPMPWAPAAPNIAGLENFTAEQAVKFMMTGERPSGVPALPPMPAFRMSREDAEAVVAYLKSLPSQK